MNYRFLLILLSIICLSMLMNQPVHAQLIFQEGFENGWTNRWYNNGVQTYGPPGNITVSTQYAREGTHSFRAQINKNDPWGGQSPRAEISSGTSTNNFFTMNTEYWVGWSIYLPSEYQFDSQTEILSQFHYHPDGCDYASASPPGSIHAHNGNWYWYMRTTSTKCLNGNTISPQVFDLGPMTKNTWTDFVLRTRFSWQNDGILQLWKDGQVVMNRVGQPNYYRDDRGPYMKVGIYKWAWLKNPSDVTSRTVYFDAVRVYQGSNGYSQVNPGIKTAQSSSVCQLKSQGDADCNGMVNLIDYDYYRRIVLGDSVPTGIVADFNGDGETGLTDGRTLLTRLGIIH